MRDTQAQAFAEIQESLGEKQLKVLSSIKKNGSTCYEISQNLNWPINRVSGRITELCNKNKIKDIGERRVNPTSGKNNIVWHKS